MELSSSDLYALRLSTNNRISRVSEHFQSRIDVIILHEQLHARRSAFHAGADSDDDGMYAGSVQRDPRQIRFEPGRICLYGLHRYLPCVA